MKTTKIEKAMSDIIYRPPEELEAWPANPRTHSKKQLVKLKASIQKFGFTAPVLIDENNTILSGHGRVEAAKELNLETVPTRVISSLTQTQKRAYVLADNKLAQLSSWDHDLLKSEMEILIEEEFSIDSTGFSTAEVDLMFDEGACSESSNDELQEVDVFEEIVSKPGDLWQLGDHLLLCGNALETDSYATLMQGNQAQMVITDPPYNVKVNGHVCGKGKTKHQEFAMASGEMSQDEFTNFLQGALDLAHDSMQEGSIIFTFMDWRHMAEIQEAAKPLFGPLRQLCIWVKDNAGMGTFYRSQHELCFTFKKGDAPHINNFELGQHGRYRTNVWEYPGVNTLKGKRFELLSMHPTVKPVAMIADALRDCSHRNGIVLDPFCGSGTILIAAERTGRKARSMELDPRYVDVAVQRWQRITGKDAHLSSTDQTWVQVSSERMAQKEESHGV